MNNPPESDQEDKPGFWSLLRDVMAFQFKLAADGLRDLFLFPISIGAAILGVVTRPNDPGHYFRQLLELGRRSDRWINLFGAADNDETGEPSSDEIVRRVEKAVVTQYERGGIVRTVKDRTDAFVERQFTERVSERDRNKSDPPES